MKRLSILFAALALSGNPTYADEPVTDDDWQFKLTPYVWLAGISGDSASDGVGLPPINPGYSFFSLENFDGVAFLDFTAKKGRWSVHSDLVFISFADTFQAGSVQSSFDFSGATLELSAGYQPARWQNTHLIFGARGVEVTMDVALNPGPSGSGSASFVDPIIGIKHQQSFANKWGVSARGDIGSGSSEMMLNATLAGTYNFTETFMLLFGYRYLKMEFEDSDLLHDLSLQGYAIGFQFAW
jgi:hypothetical protein